MRLLQLKKIERNYTITKSMKKHFISKFPNYLIISIKRFEYCVAEKKNRKIMSKIQIKPNITIDNQQYDLYSLIIHRVLALIFRGRLPMQDTISHSQSTPMNPTANGSVIMILKSLSSNPTNRSLNSWTTASRTLLTYFSLSEDTISWK